MRRSALLEEIKGLPAPEQVDYLLDLLEYYLPQGPDDLRLDTLGLRLAPSPALVLAYMAKREGWIVARAALHGALYCHRPECDRPSLATVEVFLVRIRRELRRVGLPVEIETVFGKGWRLKRAPDFRWPWEVGFEPPGASAAGVCLENT